MRETTLTEIEPKIRSCLLKFFIVTLFDSLLEKTRIEEMLCQTQFVMQKSKETKNEIDVA